MALTTQENKNKINISKPTNAFDISYSSGDYAEHSGIYKCSKCDREIAHNKNDNPLPTHYQNATCRSPNWKLFIFAQN